MSEIMRMLFVVVCALFTVLGPPAAMAHSHLDHSAPPVDGTVETAPQDVTLWFTKPLEPTFSTVEVTDSEGARVDSGKASVSGSTMSVGLRSLSPGTYHVHWHVLSVDTHTTEGDFSFRVGP
jgi:copper resistance protein C